MALLTSLHTQLFMRPFILASQIPFFGPLLVWREFSAATSSLFLLLSTIGIVSLSIISSLRTGAALCLPGRHHNFQLQYFFAVSLSTYLADT